MKHVTEPTLSNVQPDARPCSLWSRAENLHLNEGFQSEAFALYSF